MSLRDIPHKKKKRKGINDSPINFNFSIALFKYPMNASDYDPRCKSQKSPRDNEGNQPHFPVDLICKEYGVCKKSHFLSSSLSSFM
jgi:hypothetical protein